MAVKHLVTWGIGFSPDAGDWPKYQPTHGMDIGTEPVVSVIFTLYHGWLDTQGPDKATT